MIQKIKQCFNNIKYRSKLILLCILVSFLPLSVMGFFCYNQTINLLRTRELDSLESSILSVSNSLDSKVNTYQNLLAYLANSNVLAEFSSYNEANAYDQYEYLNYTMDVFLNTTYLQHPEISQITIYNANNFVQSAIWKMNPGIFLKQFHLSLPGIKRRMEHFALSNTYVILILHISAPTQKTALLSN